jgi:multidrug resistance protein, MATE family
MKYQNKKADIDAARRIWRMWSHHPCNRFIILLLLLLLNLTKSGVRCLAIGNPRNCNINEETFRKYQQKLQGNTPNGAISSPFRCSQSLASHLQNKGRTNSLQASASDDLRSSSNDNNNNPGIHPVNYTHVNENQTPDLSTETPLGDHCMSIQESEEAQHSLTLPVGMPPASSSLPVSKSIKSQQPYLWPCGDELDKELIKISLPVIGNYAISPLIGAVDLFWVNRMGNALAVAGQAASNQVFSSAFWFVSFLPSVTATLVSKQHARGDQEGTQDAVCQALFVGFFIALIGTPAMFLNPDWALSSVLTPGAPAMDYARPYLLIRSFAFLPSLVSLVGFSAFRGVLDTQTPVKISALANVFNALLDPVLIFTWCMGVPGAALATLAAEVISAVIYLTLMRKQNLILWRKLIKPPSWASLEPLLKGGLALQVRNLSLNLTFLAVARVTQSIDRSGVAAAAHAMAIQTFQIGGIVLLALSTVAQTVVPNAMIERLDETTRQPFGGLDFAKATVNRLMSWGLVLGCALGLLQILLLPAIRSATPLQEVKDAAKIPAIIASVLQIINGLVFIGEG